MLEILDLIDASLANGRVVFVQCWGGIGRTGTAIGCYHLYVLNELELGRADVTAGRVVPHDQVARELRRKWVLGASG